MIVTCAICFHSVNVDGQCTNDDCARGPKSHLHKACVLCQEKCDSAGYRADCGRIGCPSLPPAGLFEDDEPASSAPPPSGFGSLGAPVTWAASAFTAVDGAAAPADYSELNLIEVDYDHPTASDAQKLRLSMARGNVENLKGRNVATLFVQTVATYNGKDYIQGTEALSAASESFSAANRRPVYKDDEFKGKFETVKRERGTNAPTRHSEKVCWGMFANRFGAPKSESLVIEGKVVTCSVSQRVKAVYTEREPCGPQNANCTRLLKRILTEHGIDGISTPVFFSFYWPDANQLDGSMTRKEAEKLASTYRKIGTNAVRYLEAYLELRELDEPTGREERRLATATKKYKAGQKGPD